MGLIIRIAVGCPIGGLIYATHGNLTLTKSRSFEIDYPEQIAVLAKLQQLATAIKQGRKLERCN